MTARARTIYRCTNCGADYPRWAGRCDICGEWNTLVEEAAPRVASATGLKNAASRRAAGPGSLGAGGSVAP
ncbi:MAG: DNA repair protein RadA, partial [Gemmatimonadota bacterium]|nr:DNA repair protein RadA [Gemmatimonadota bacterium]